MCSTNKRGKQGRCELERLGARCDHEIKRDRKGRCEECLGVNVFRR